MVSVLIAACARAQTLNVQVGSVTYAIPAAQAGEMVYANGTTLTILGKTFVVSDIDRMYIDDTAVTDNTVSVSYDGAAASVTVAGNIARYVTPVVSGAHVSLTQSNEVGESTCGEITYVLSGESNNGEFYMEGSYKTTVELRGLSLSNPNGAPLDIQNGKRIVVSLKNGTENTLADCTGGNQKGCLVCKGHLELKGKGTLNIYGNTAHAIYAKEYVEMKNCTVNVLSAVKDGLNCNQYFLLESGSLHISGTGDDGIQVSFKDETDREAEDTGSISIEGGTLTVATTAVASKGIKADGDVTVSGGTLEITASGGGKWDMDEAKTKSATCISCDGNMQIDGGTLILSSTGSGGKGINSSGNLAINDGVVTISTHGGMYAYVNGREYDNYTGNTDRLGSNYKSSPKGIKADGNVTISGGIIGVTTAGTGGEGVESKKAMTVSGGVVEVEAYDDALNAATDITISGGRIYCYSTANDGIDSNGTLNLNGGLIVACGLARPEEGLDCDQSKNFKINGGTIIALGSNVMAAPSSASMQRTVIYNRLSATSGTMVCILDSSGEPIMAYALPCAISSASLTFSAPELVAGSYTVSTGGTLSGFTDSWRGWHEGGTWSNGTQVGTFTSNNVVTTVNGNNGPGGGGGGPGGGGGGPSGGRW